MTTAGAVTTAAGFCWLGMVLAISFLEAPLKFRAPGVTCRSGSVSAGWSSAPSTASKSFSPQRFSSPQSSIRPPPAPSPPWWSPSRRWSCNSRWSARG